MVALDIVRMGASHQEDQPYDQRVETSSYQPSREEMGLEVEFNNVTMPT